MPISNEIKAVIDQVRAQHPQLAALSDEQILHLMMRAQQQAAGDLSDDDIDRMTAEECGVRGEQLLNVGRWDEAERFLFAQLKKAEAENDLDQQCKAAGRFIIIG